MTKQMSTVAVKTPLKAMPVPEVERIVGFTTTMYDIVKKVVIPAIASVRRLIGDRLQAAQDIRTHKPRIIRICANRIYTDPSHPWLAFSLQGVLQLLRVEMIWMSCYVAATTTRVFFS